MKLQLARAQALLNQKKPNPDQAVKVLQPLVNGKNTPWKAYHISGVAFFMKKEFAKAESLFSRALEKGSKSAEIYYFIGHCRHMMSDQEGAIEHLKTAVELNRDYYAGWMKLGDVQKEAGNLDEAMKCYGQCNRIDPSKSEVAMKTGEIYRDQAFSDKALEMFEIVLKMEPKNISALNEKAKLLKSKLDLESAEEVIRQALKIAPENAALHFTLAEILRGGGDFLEALGIYEEILARKPKLGAARTNYANILQDLGRLNEAEENFLQASKDNPSIQESFSNYLFVQHYNPEKTKEEIFNAHKKWDLIYAPEKPQRPLPENRGKDKTLRVGLVSGGFRKHPVGWMIVAGMEHLPKDAFELVYYSNHSKVDDITRRLHKTASEWRVITGYSDDKVNQMIRDDKIDILIELSGHAAESRLCAVAMEPAPVVVKWVGGLFNTTGLKAIDYLITDRIETPAGSESDYFEKLVRMPDDYICFTPSPDSPVVKESPFIENGYITFGCFNNPIKVNPILLEKWADVMKQVPKSRLFLKSKQYGNAFYTRRIEEQMKAFGIGKERLIFEGYSPHSELLEAYNRVDIALDPWPYSGGLTTCEALWMGAPVVTYPGPTFAGRHAATHLINAGLPELVAGTWEEYIEKTVELATYKEELAKLRAGLRSQVADSPLADGPRFGAHFAKAMRATWHQWVDGFENGKKDWQSHIDVHALDDQQIERPVQISKPSDDVQGLLDHIENEMNGTASEDIKQLDEPGPTNGVHTNGSSRTNGALSNSKAKEDEPDVYKIETTDGVTICTPPDLKMMTPYVLLEQKQWYENELDFMREYLKPGMSVVDVGAGFGVYALPAAKYVGDEGKVFAFEPGSVAKNHLEMSKLENSFQNLEVIGKAVSAKNGKHAWKIADTPELNRLDESGEEQISAVTLDAWWQFEGEPKIDLIKLDVNGSEDDALEGAKELLKQQSPVVLVSIAEQNDGSVTKSLMDAGYNVYEYIPGPGILADHDLEAGADPYMQNLIAIPENQIEQFKIEGWLHNESVKTNEIENDLWKTEMSKLPWTHELMEQWKNHGDSERIMSYLQALNFLIAAEQMNTKDTEVDQPRSKKAGLLLGAAQILIQLYNQGADSTAIVFTLVRTLNALGKRGQAVEVMQRLIETTKLGQKNMNVDLPFMLPFPEQDSAPIKTDLNKWLMVRTVEAWIFLKDLTTYLSGPQEQKLLEVLEGNPEVKKAFNRPIKILQYLTKGERDFSLINDLFCPALSKELTFSHDRSDYFKAMVKMIREKGVVSSDSHSLPGELIVSLTSYPERFENLPLTLLCLINQRVSPDKIILWIAEGDKDALTEEIIQFGNHGVEIRFCEDLKSYKKIIPTLETHPEAFIITADDDLYYNKRWIQGLVQDYESNNCVVAHRVHRISFDETGKVKPYKDWGWQYRKSYNPSELNFPTSGAGTLYPPGIFHKDVTNYDLFRQLSPTADDVWLYFMVKLNGGKFKVSRSEHKLVEWKQKNPTTLWKENLIKGKNDEQINNALEYYGIKIADHSENLFHNENEIFDVRSGNINYRMVLPNWGEDHIQKIIANTHVPYEFSMLNDMQKRLSATGLFIDIGANIGNHTLFMAINTGCKVIAFEPNFKLVNALNESIKINNLEDRIQVINKGVGKQKSFARFEEEKKFNIGAQKLKCSNEKSSIEIIDLDSMLPLENLKMMKIDVEGMELDVLEGSLSVIKKYKPLLYIEANTKNEFTKIYNVLKSEGYEYIKSFNATPTHLFIVV